MDWRLALDLCKIRATRDIVSAPAHLSCNAVVKLFVGKQNALHVNASFRLIKSEKKKPRNNFQQ